jgi:hypothetical protein
MYSMSSTSIASSYELANITNAMEQNCIINENNQLCIYFSGIPALKTQDTIACCIQHITYKIQHLLMLNDMIDIHLYITEDVKIEMFKTVKIFFDLFKKELPNKLNKLNIYTKAKYKGVASMLLTFADRETKSRMEIHNI